MNPASTPCCCKTSTGAGPRLLPLRPSAGCAIAPATCRRSDRHIERGRWQRAEIILGPTRTDLVDQLVGQTCLAELSIRPVIERPRDIVGDDGIGKPLSLLPRNVFDDADKAGVGVVDERHLERGIHVVVMASLEHTCCHACEHTPSSSLARSVEAPRTWCLDRMEVQARMIRIRI